LVWVLWRISASYGWLLFLQRVLEMPVEPAHIEALHRRNAHLYRKAAERLKGATIKLGQLLSARVDVVPMACVEELRQLQDSVEPEPYAYVAAQIEKELGQPPEVLFSRIEPQALAAASFGQVHRAWTREGEAVAVKVQHAHVRESLAIDLFCFGVLVSIFGPLFPQLHLKQINDEMEDALRRELRYDEERAAGERVRANFAGDARVVVPKSYPALSSRSVLTTAFIEGYKVNNLDAIRARGVEPAEVLRVVIDAFTRQIYVHGFFQSDPHPGNLFFIPAAAHENSEDGSPPPPFQIGIIDFGQSKEIPAEFKGHLRKSVLGVVMRDEGLLVEGTMAMGVIGPKDAQVMRELVAHFSDKIQTGSAEEWNSLDYHEMSRQLWTFLDRVEELHIPADLVLYGRTLGILHGLATEMGAGLNVFEVARPHLMTFLFSGGR
jgi:predicted unusual protein kinase regulating ubiquinone biosynthesis (AarF/ABC1/UbiB family)